MANIRSGPLESRRNHAACFKNKKTEDWQADYSGVIVLESGEKFWVNLYEKRTSQGDTYFGLVLRPKQETGKRETPVPRHTRRPEFGSKAAAAKEPRDWNRKPAMRDVAQNENGEPKEFPF